MDPHLSLAAALARAAVAIHAQRTLADTVAAIAQAAVTLLPGFDHAGVSAVRRDGTVETLAATDELVRRLDHVQYDARQGPCLEAIEHGSVVAAEHLRTDRRWPTYLPAAVGLGVRAQLGVGLDVAGRRFGGLSLYSTTSSRVDPEAVHVARLLAAHASTALAAAQEADQLREGLASRKVIGQAIGIAMERYGISDERAFQFLLRTSSTTNTKLRDVAQRLVDETDAQGQAADLEAI